MKGWVESLLTAVGSLFHKLPLINRAPGLDDNMQTTDEKLRAILDRIPRSASPRTPNGFAAATEAVRAHSGLIEEVFACLRNHPDLSFEGSLFFDSAHLHIQPYSGAMSLAAYALWRGSDQAMDWYRRVIGTRSTQIRHASLVSGLTTKGRIDFSNGVSILPLEHAGDAPQVAFTRSLSMAHPLQNILGCHYNAMAFRDVEHQRTDQIPTPPVDHEIVAAIEDILVGCILNEGLAPALIINWEEFLDPELRAAETSWGTGGFPQEAPVAHGRDLRPEDVPNIELFLSLDGSFKDQLRVALTRVGLARRKHTSANRAIEYSIALEALLSDGNAEMTHKIATRAAVILGETFEERVQYRKLFKKLYQVRSLAVHGRDVSKGDESQVVRDSEKAISRLLLIAAKRGEEFDFDKLDLSAEI